MTSAFGLNMSPSSKANEERLPMTHIHVETKSHETQQNQKCGEQKNGIAKGKVCWKGFCFIAQDCLIPVCFTLSFSRYMTSVIFLICIKMEDLNGVSR